MLECISIEYNTVERSNIYTNLNEITLSDQQRFRLNKINEAKDYFIAEIKERELTSKRYSKYIAFSDYFDVFNCFTNTFLLHHLQRLLEHL